MTTVIGFLTEDNQKHDPNGQIATALRNEQYDMNADLGSLHATRQLVIDDLTAVRPKIPGGLINKLIRAVDEAGSGSSVFFYVLFYFTLLFFILFFFFFFFC